MSAEQRRAVAADLGSLAMESDPPPGFEPLFRTSPFLDHNGPFFYRENDDGTFVVGLRIQTQARQRPRRRPWRSR